MNDPYDLGCTSGNGVRELSAAAFDSLETAARAGRLHVSRIDLETCRDKAGLLAGLARDLAFPSSFGNNWDALADCLQDLDWLPMADGHVLLVEQAGNMRSAAPRDFGTFLEILEQAGDFWAAQGKVFRVFLATD